MKLFRTSLRHLLCAALLFVSLQANSQYADITWYHHHLDFTEVNAMEHALHSGYILAGGNDFFNSDTTARLYKVDDTGALEWFVDYNDTRFVKFMSIIRTADSSYVVLGNKENNYTYLDSSIGWVLKLDDTGGIIWQHTYGSSGREMLNDIKQTSDGGFIACGSRKINNGDFDLWIIKLDGQGSLQWEKEYGGTWFDVANSVCQTANGDFIVLGTVNSSDGDVSNKYFGEDYWLLKLNASGDLLWEKNYGGNGYDYGMSVIEASDGNYVLAGYTSSHDVDVSFNNSMTAYNRKDVWVVKTDQVGSIIWEKCYGGSDNEMGYKIRETTVGNYSVVGSASTTQGPNGDLDCVGQGGWILNIDNNGNLNWKKQVFAYIRDVAYSGNGGYIVAGEGRHNSMNSWGTAYVARFDPSSILSCEQQLDVQGVASEIGDIEVYPTITTGRLTIGLPDAFKSASVQLSDLLGRPVDISVRETGKLSREVSIGLVPAGMYLLTISNGNAKRTFKIIYQP